MWAPYFVLLVALALTALAAYYVRRTAHTADRMRFENAVQRTQTEVERRLETYSALLRSGAGLFAASTEVTRADFKAFTDRLGLRAHYPGIQGLGYTVRLRPEDRAALVARMRQTAPDFTLRPDYERSEYHAIVYLEPLDRRNQAAIGYDMFTDAVRRAAMEQARDTGEPAASGRVTLVQEVEGAKQAGFLIYVPVYRAGQMPATVEARRDALAGFVYGPFRADDLLTGIFAEQQPEVDFEVYDGAAEPANLLHDSRAVNAAAGSHQPLYTATTTTKVGGRPWTFRFASRPAFEQGSQRLLVPFIVAGGMLISLLFFFVTRAQVRARAAAETAARSLAQSEARFRTLVEQSPLSTQILAPDGRTLQVNRAWEELWGVTLDQLRDYNMLKDEQLVAKGIMPYIERGFAGEATDIPAILYDPNETIPGRTTHADPRRWVRAVIYPVRDEQGRIREVVLVHQDITEQKRAQEELAEANRIKDEFLATLSHELRTPLTSILGWARMLATGALDDSMKTRAAEIIERNARAQTQLIDDLLDVSRVITGKLRLDVRPVALARTVETVVDSMKPAAAARDLHVELQLDPAAGEVFGDPDRLHQIIGNLLSNAIKFTPPGGRIGVRSQLLDGHVELRVSDTGQGIAPDFLPHIFDRFRQADSSITRRHGGLGLGLAIVHHLVELHGGTVRAESAGIGHGATFIVRLPVAGLPVAAGGSRNEADRGKQSAGEANDQAASRNPNSAISPGREPQSAVLSGLRVLVVDDDADTLTLLKTMLVREGAEVAAVSSAAEALTLVPRFFPEVLVSDISMPDVDGYELLRKVRALPGDFGGQVPALALTAHARAEDRAQTLAAGYQAHVVKPVEPAQLIEQIATLAGRRTVAP
jgi:signal transduction histidine kinase/CheY-like chemotaxis protein